MKIKTQAPTVHIDGSQGEGGGQILRTALSLSAITGRPFSLTQIRAGRKKPGLMRQHLTCVESVAEICGAKTSDPTVGSTELEFEPGPIRALDASFAIGTAGSTSLLAQAILPVALCAPGASEFVLSGGTHVMASPSTDFLADLFLPALQEMGAEVELKLERHGFFPAGGGQVRLKVQPFSRRIPFERHEKPASLEVGLEVLMTKGVPPEVAEKEIAQVEKAFGADQLSKFVLGIRNAASDGNAVILRASEPDGAVRALSCAPGSRGVRAEKVAQTAIRGLKRFLTGSVPIDEHLADQLLLPLALVGEGSFTTGELTPHFHTNCDVIRRFLEVEIKIDPRPNGENRVSVQTV